VCYDIYFILFIIFTLTLKETKNLDNGEIKIRENFLIWLSQRWLDMAFYDVRINIVEHRFRVIVMPRKDLLDPQGRAVKGVISEMGIKVKDVKVGKVIEIVIEEKDEGRAWETVEELSRKVFSNPIIEDYKIEKI